ncbi:MAG TPA: flagellar hook-associated protein FlgL [Candidatus Sulfotelmatobacter sp.]|nr:flagellar hook-associated protein FlgL [Candidatus Sulfotelmatobacter sp.]
MRIATSTIYAQQTAAIDNQAAQYAQLGGELSSGISLNEPSDDPLQIGEDLELHQTITTQTTESTNASAASNQLTQTDSVLNGLTSILQSANSLAVEAANSGLTSTDRSGIVSQVNNLISQAIAYGNSQYSGQYIFSGTAASTLPPVQAVGDPPTSVTFSGNEQSSGQILFNGQVITLSTTFQQAFNYNSADGSPDVFQTLINLRNQVENPQYTDTSEEAMNAEGQVVYGPQTGGAPAPTTLSQASSFATAPVAGGGGFTIEINGTSIPIAANAPIDDGVPPPAGTSVVAQINNAAAADGGVTAQYDAKTQKITLSSSSAFTVQDAPNGGNLVEALGLAGQGDTIQPISTQLGDISNTLNVVLTARAQVGANLQTLTSLASQLQSNVTDNTNVESSIEDTNVASTTTAFTQTQTALEAAYSTTTRLEQQTLFNYLQ